MVEKVPLIGLILMVVAFIADVALSFGTMYWYYRKDESGSTTTKYLGGIWRYCVNVDVSGVTSDTCYFHTDTGFPLDNIFVGSTQTFQSVGIVLVFFSILCGILKLFVGPMKENPSLLAAAAAQALWGSICLIGSAGAFGKGVDRNTSLNVEHLHFSYAFAVISGVIGLVGAIILIVACVKGGNSSTSPKA